MSLKQRVPFLRWSFWRMAIGARNLTKTGQIGDGREAAVADYVVAKARQGDIDDVIAKVDQFAYEKSFLINVGDEKGELLDAAVRRANPGLALELGTYCGYGSLRITRAAPSAKVFSVELAEANAVVARRIWAHAGVDDLFIDHDKGAYLPDLQSILHRGWLHRGSIVIADNMLIPGSPKYREFMNQQQGKLFDTVEHRAHGEYQTLAPDVVFESEYLGG
jgi:catechol O-methyltransferase